MIESRKSQRGFASMNPERQREIASKGGRAAHLKGTAHEFTADEARTAGKKGGMIVSRDRAHMAAIGREGGFASRLKRESLKRAPVQNSPKVPTLQGPGVDVPQVTTPDQQQWTA